MENNYTQAPRSDLSTHFYLLLSISVLEPVLKLGYPKPRSVYKPSNAANSHQPQPDTNGKVQQRLGEVHEASLPGGIVGMNCGEVGDGSMTRTLVAVEPKCSYQKELSVELS